MKPFAKRGLAALLALMLSLSLLAAPASASSTGYSARTPLGDAYSDRADNIRQAVWSIGSVSLASGETFSFNDAVGPRTAEYGYEVAVNGRGARVRGGGVAQVASAVWLAAKNLDDVSIVEKSTYGKRYNQNYVASSSDAIVTDYSAGTDFSFCYTGSSTLEIYTWYEDGALYCQIF